jgi:hypothetical protein
VDGIQIRVYCLECGAERASLKARKTIGEARKDLTAYALKRGWQRVCEK